jgi:TolB-like protein
VRGQNGKEVILMKIKRILILLLLSFILTLPSISTTQTRYDSIPTRDPNRVYRVAILPFLIHSQENLDYLREGIYDILTSRITVDGKIMVVERSLVEQALFEERPMRLDETVATKIGMRVGADYVILGSLTKVGNYISLDARLLSITEEKPPQGVYTQHKGIEDVMVKIGDFAQEMGNKILEGRPMMGRPGEPKRPYISQQRSQSWRIGSEDLGFKKSQIFDFGVKGLDIGDVDGDKKNEMIIMDEHNLYIFKYDGDKLTYMRKIATGSAYNLLTLDVADINRNGVAEIIVTAVIGDELRSFILEFEEGEFKKITEQADWYFRVLEHPKDGLTLMGQRMGDVVTDSDSAFSGPIYRFVWKKHSFDKGPKMPFPKGITIFGLAMGDIRGKGTSDLVAIEDSGQLTIMSPDKRKNDKKSSWTSGENYGGTINFYDNDAKKKLWEATKALGTTNWRVFIPGRILVRDLDGDGFNEVIVNKNISPALALADKARIFKKGEIHDLVWDGGTLITNWKTKEINGYISDFQIKDVDNDGNEEMVVSVTDLGKILDRRPESSILFFELF